MTIGVLILTPVPLGRVAFTSSCLSKNGIEFSRWRPPMF